MTEQTITAFREGDVVDYNSERRDRWCREGVAVATPHRDGTLMLVDTYWGGFGSDQHVLTATETATAQVRFNLNDYEEITASGARDRWLKYAPADRDIVTSQHRLQAKYFIRRGATEDLPTQILNAEERLEEARSQLESAQWRVEWAERDLQALKEQANHA